jgi:hypothetical protein
MSTSIRIRETVALLAQKGLSASTIHRMLELAYKDSPLANQLITVRTVQRLIGKPKPDSKHWEFSDEQDLGLCKLGLDLKGALARGFGRPIEFSIDELASTRKIFDGTDGAISVVTAYRVAQMYQLRQNVSAPVEDLDYWLALATQDMSVDMEIVRLDFIQMYWPGRTPIETMIAILDGFDFQLETRNSKDSSSYQQMVSLMIQPVTSKLPNQAFTEEASD